MLFRFFGVRFVPVILNIFVPIAAKCPIFFLTCLLLFRALRLVVLLRLSFNKQQVVNANAFHIRRSRGINSVLVQLGLFKIDHGCSCDLLSQEATPTDEFRFISNKKDE